MKKSDVCIGQSATCKTPVHAYYSGYAGNPLCEFTPEDVGLVAAVDVPNVRTPGSFVCVDFQKHGQEWRCALRYDNIVIKKGA